MSGRQIVAVCGVIVALLLMTIWGGALTFSNPDMTRTRLLLTFWPHYLAQTALLLVACGWAWRELGR